MIFIWVRKETSVTSDEKLVLPSGSLLFKAGAMKHNIEHANK